MNTSELIHVGIRGSVVALDRQTGAIVWATPLKGSDFVNVLLDQDHLYATARGEIFCLDARTGQSVWHNPLKGYGTGLVTLAAPDSLRAGVVAALAEKRQRDQQAAAASAASAA